MVGQKTFSKWLIIIVFLLPSLAGLVLFQLIPLLSSAVISFTDWDLITKARFVGFDNYLEALGDEQTLSSLLNIVRYIVGYLPTVLVLGLFFSVLLGRKMKGVKLYRIFIFIPVITSWVAVAIVWRWLLNGQSGLVNYFLSFFGVQGPIWLQDFTWAMPAIIAVSIWKDIGYVTIILLAGLQEISDDYYEAAIIDGASGIGKFFNITLPLLTPSLFFVIVISLINGFQLFDQVMVMTRGGPAGATATLVQQIYENAFQNYKMGFASAQSWILFLIIFAVTLIQQSLQKRWVTYDR
ncbi:sugar ABC transporter permease [Paenibacillus darwinianus]|uniref:Sugar ABC transporter permease n=1 Tax=Paenibacillus darwinianus TaxID=1380763 RepID=A0A9W5W7G4_9BACL|nr:sugar ABC transporter permease [Paenibacillus darwinianus]EXX85902.1 sugar ABC transporter permease [Paenibacillus darwinianus]EXX88132.1 sugar ABC transporter permease [Paenibacillus darwinianus]EXX88733.1 sugar ABC transporter permease [Paenibacillus darwinianus]